MCVCVIFASLLSWPSYFSLAWINFQRTLSSLEMPGAVSIACEPSNILVNESTLNENQERIDSGSKDGTASVSQYHGRPRHRVDDPARDISIQVLEKFSLVTKFARETTSQLFGDQSNGFGAIERSFDETPLDHHKKSASVGDNVPDDSPVPSDPLEVTLPISGFCFHYITC